MAARMGQGQALIHWGFGAGRRESGESLKSQAYVRIGPECPKLLQAWVVADLHAAYLGSRESIHEQD